MNLRQVIGGCEKFYCEGGFLDRALKTLKIKNSLTLLNSFFRNFLLSFKVKLLEFFSKKLF